MAAVPVEIIRFVDEGFPGFVECLLTDADGQQHHIVEKVSVVTTEHLCADSAYPARGIVACEVGLEWTDSKGRSLARINTERPWGIESTEGATTFVVLSSQVLSSEPNA
jgi:hypothetical protein